MINPLVMFKIHYIFTFTMAGYFMYLFMKKKFGFFPSFVSALVFMFSLANTVRVNGSLAFVVVYAFIPLSFLIIDEIINGKIFYFIFLSLIMFFQLSAGHPQFFLYSSTGLFFYFVYKFFTNKFPWKSLLSVGVSAVLFFIMCIPTIIPFYTEIAGMGKASAGFVYMKSMPLTVTHFITIIMPNFFGSLVNGTYWGPPNYSELSIYLGIFPLLLIIVSFLFKKDKSYYFFLFLTLFALVFSISESVQWFFFNYIPLYELFRVPARMLILYSFSMSVLAGYGANVLFTKDNSMLIKVLAVISSLSILTSVFVVVGKNLILSVGERVLNHLYYVVYADSIFVSVNSFEGLLPLIEPAYGQILFSIIVFTGIIIFSLGIFWLIGKRNTNSIYNKLLIILLILTDLWIFGIQFTVYKGW